MSELERAKAKHNQPTKLWSEKVYKDSEQYPAAAKTAGLELHGIFTEQGAESQNAASNEFRKDDAALSVMRGMITMYARQHADQVKASANEHIWCPPRFVCSYRKQRQRLIALHT